MQARTSSTRLPRKVLELLGEKTMLESVVTRLQGARCVDEVVVATSQDAEDDAIEALCAGLGVACFRGSRDDVLARFAGAARRFDAQTIVRITADCPLLDPVIVDRCVEEFVSGAYDYVSNTLHGGYPDGLDVEVFSRAALELAVREAEQPFEREHVTPFLRSDSRFRRGTLNSDLPARAAHYRWTVDERADLDWMRRVYSLLEPIALSTRWNAQTVLKLLDSHPSLLAAMPSTVANEGFYRSLFEEARGGAAPALRLNESQKWFERARHRIPGAAQTFSKGADQHVRGVAPLFLQSGQGARVRDVDGNEFVDYVQGLLPNILGYAHPEVNAAAHAQAQSGHSFSLPHPLEVELAEKLSQIIPCAEMVRFGKNGSDATAGAIRVARAFTGRERVALCGYHGWQDWFIGSTSRSAGVPRAVRDLAHPFAYNDLASLQNVLESHPNEFAAVILEPFNFVEPQAGFLEGVQELAREHGALLVFDEICSGWHLGLGGAQKEFGVVPDLACFGKAMGNGWPISAVVGRTEVMRMFEEAFVSFTFAGEVASIAASLKVIEILETSDALARIAAAGRRLQDGFNTFARLASLESCFECVGRPQWSLLRFRDEMGRDSLLARSLWAQETVRRGVLQLVTHNLSAAHDEAAVNQTLEAYAAVFKTLAEWLGDADPARHLDGAPIEPVFRVRG